MRQNNLSQPNDKEFLQETNSLSDTDFVLAVFNSYLKRSIDEQAVNELVKILQELQTRENFITSFIRPSPEFQNLWPSPVPNSDRPNTNAQNIAATPRQETVLSESDGDEIQIINRYLKTIEDVPLNRVNIDNQFLRETARLSNINFIKTVFRVYLKRPSVECEQLEELLGIFEEIKSREVFLKKFVKLSTEYSILWPAVSEKNKSNSQTKSSNASEAKLEKLLLKNKTYDEDIFDKYLEMVKDMPVNLIDDLEFLSATDNFNNEDFLQAVWTAYYKAPIDDMNKSLFIGYIDQKPSRRALIKCVVRPGLEASTISVQEKVIVGGFQLIGKIIAIAFMPVGFICKLIKRLGRQINNIFF